MWAICLSIFEIAVSLLLESISQEEVLIPLDEAQRRHVLRVIQELGGDKAAAAQVLGVSRATVYRIASKGAHQ